MESDGTMDGSVGLRLTLEGKKTLTIGDKNLELYDPAASRSKRGSCYPLSPSATTNQTVPLYNVLWAEISDNKITIDFAVHESKTLIKANKWTFAIASAGDNESSTDAFVRTLCNRAYGEAKPQKRAYVLINPNAGPGGALRLWKNEVKPIFEAARMKLDVVVLTRGGEATELVEKVDLTKYDTIMACSGDGTPFEIFNGLGNRPDAGHALSTMPVSHVPCGSGNAFSCNLYGSHRASFAALAIAKGVDTAMDLVSVTYGDKRILSFLSQALGLIAESDLGTEHLRWMGSLRFDYGVVSRIFKRTCYPCDLAVKVEVEEKANVKAHYKRYASNTSLNKLANDAANGTVDGMVNGTTNGTTNGYSHKGLPGLKYGTVQDPLPEGWELVSHDNIGTFYAGNMAYMAPDVNFFSASLIADGCMDLVTIDGNLSPLAAASAMMQVDSPKFFDNPHVKYKKITAYRIIPRNQKNGFISIDGEKIPFGPIQAEIHQGLGRVISKSGKYETDGPADWDKVTVSERIHA
ncbi:sphingosine kinase [Mariannaea sp. PMI_226]|nr:sphingosine kinase [Mariannaea sp. PMI_226]